MTAHLRANLWLLVLTVLLCSVLYPLVFLGIGQTVFHDKAQGSLLTDAQGQPIGSRLIAQPFTADEYFQPRPSAASYNAAASGASNWAASNYLLRDRVARQLGPIVKYRGGPKKGQLVGPDIESWFQKDHFDGKPGIVAQWAACTPAVAQNWVKADKLNAAYVADWQKTHPQKSPSGSRPIPTPRSQSPKTWPCRFSPDSPRPTRARSPAPSSIRPRMGKRRNRSSRSRKGATSSPASSTCGCKTTRTWIWSRVPADMVTASGSGLDPDITLSNALWQLDRVAAAWAKKTGRRDEATIREEIDQLLRAEEPRAAGRTGRRAPGERAGGSTWRCGASFTEAPAK